MAKGYRAEQTVYKILLHIDPVHVDNCGFIN